MKIRHKHGEPHVSLTATRKELEQHRDDVTAFLNAMAKAEAHARSLWEANKKWIRGKFDPEKHHVGSLSIEVVHEPEVKP